MDNLQPNLNETQSIETATPKPPVIATIETYQQAHTEWNSAESQRLEMFAMAKKTNLPTDEYSQPTLKSAEVIKSEELSELARQTKLICDDAFGEWAKPEAFDALITELTNATPATPERVIQAGVVIENISYYRRNPNRAGEVLEKYPEALYLPDTQEAVRKAASELTRSVESLRAAATIKPEDSQNSSKLLEIAVSENSPLEKSLKDQLRDTLDLVRGVKARQLVDSFRDDGSTELYDPKSAPIKKDRLAIISQVVGIPLEMTSLEDALNQHKKLLENRALGSYYQQSLSRNNFGEALAALSQRTEDPVQQRHLEALAIGYAAAIEPDPTYSRSEKASNVLMALVLDTKDPEISAYDTVHKIGKNPDDVLSRLLPMVSDHPSHYHDSDIFSHQNTAAVRAKNARIAAETARANEEKAQAEKLAAEVKAAGEQLAAVKSQAAVERQAPTKVTPAKNRSFVDKMLGR